MRTVGFATALVAVAACTHQLPVRTQTPAQVENAALGCPLSQPVPIDANVMDVPGGVSITFTGPPRAVERIRANVFAMQDANTSQGDPFAVCPCVSSAILPYSLAPPTYGESIDQHAGPGPGADDPNGNLTIDGRMLMQPTRTVPATASIDEIPEGAMLVLKPKDALQLERLRDSVRANVGAMEMACVNAR